MPESATTFGLDDPELVELAASLAPDLFGALRVAHRLRGELPIASMDELSRLLFADGVAAASAYRATRDDVEDMCFTFPVTDCAELVRRLYVAAGHAHEKAHRPLVEAMKQVP